MIDLDLKSILTLTVATLVPVGIFLLQKNKCSSSSVVSSPSDTEIEEVLREHPDDRICGVVSQLYIHPLKGAKPLQVNSMELDKWGPNYDRRWFIVDSKNKVGAAKAFRKLLTIKPSLDNGYLVLETAGSSPLRIELERDLTDAKVEEFELYGDKGSAIEESGEASSWISSQLGRSDNPVRLMRSTAARPRSVTKLLLEEYKLDDGANNDPFDEVQFSDLTSLLVLSEESLASLNSEIQKDHPDVTVTLEDFRANVILKGVPKPYAEDDFSTFRINDTYLKGAIPCTRCSLTTMDKETLEYRESREPLRTLERDRTVAGRGCMGQCVQHMVKSTGGTISVGDKVYVRSFKQFPFPFNKNTTFQ